MGIKYDKLLGKIRESEQGEKGDTGDVGPTGPAGETGDTGATGSQGIQGVKGDDGDQGLQGIQGPQGDTGATGATGADSTVPGPQGNTGDDGATGPQGTQGETGLTGDQGIQGVKGDTGDTGSQGIQGVAGDDGAIGPTGATGPQGTAGAKGDKGDTGDTGSQGIQGVQGDTGSAGADGADGSDASVTKANVEAVLTGEISSHSHAGGDTFSMNMLQLTQQTMQQHDSTGDLAIEWKQQDITNSNFTHSTTTNSEVITCNTAGWLDIRFSIQYDQDDTARLTTEGYIEKNGIRLTPFTGNRSYYRGLAYSRWGTASETFYLQVAANDTLELHSGVADGNNVFPQNRAIDTIPANTYIQLRHLG